MSGLGFIGYIIDVDIEYVISIKLDDGKRFYNQMTQGISSSLNLALMRINTIQNNFAALENMAQGLSSVGSKSEFQTILDAKISKADENGAIDSVKNQSAVDKLNKSIEEKIDSSPLDFDLDMISDSKLKNDLKEILDDSKVLKKDAVNLKSKIDLSAQLNDVDEIIETFSQKYDVDSNFIKAIIKQESGFNPKATSKKGAMGLMQLMPKTAESLGVVNAYNPWENVEGGVKHLKGLLKTYDANKELALAAYNAGSGAVKKYGGIPPYKETQNYVNSIMTSYNKLNEVKL